MSILKSHIKQNFDLKQINLIQSKLPDSVIRKFNEISKQIEHLTFPQKLDLVKQGNIVPVDNYYLKLKKFIYDKDLEKKLKKKLHSDFFNNLPEIAKKSCPNCEDVPQIKRSCEYFNSQLQHFLFFLFSAQGHPN